MKKLLSWILISVMLLSLTGCSGLSIPTKEAAGSSSAQESGNPDGTADSSTESYPVITPPLDIPGEENDPGVSALSVSFLRSQYTVGEEGTVDFVVRYESSVSGSVQLRDQNDTVLAEFQTDGSGLQQGIFYADTSVPQFLTVRAGAGSEESLPVILRIVPKVTEAMLQTLLEVGDDLAKEIENKFPEGVFSPDARKQLIEYLKADSRVENAVENLDIILFRTVDGLIGGVDVTEPAGPEDPLCFSYHNTEDTFKAVEEGTDVSDWVIYSENVMTNDHIRYVVPLRDNDPVVDVVRPAFSDQLQEMADLLDFQYYHNASAEAGLHMFLNPKELTDSGLLVMNTHGSVLQRSSDSSNLLLMDVRGWQQGGNIFGDMYEFGDWFYGSLEQPEANDLIFMLDLRTADPKTEADIQNTGKITSSIYMTSTLLMTELGDTLFDNTIVYLMICYAFSDNQLVRCLRDHGAAAVIGSREPLNVLLAGVVLERLLRTLTAVKEDGTYHTLGEVQNSTVIDFDAYERELLIRYREYETEENYYKEKAAQPVYYLIREPERVFKGTSDIRGKVTDIDGEGLAGVEVKLYRWLDHEFKHEKKHTAETDVNGNYHLDDVDCGVYYIKAEYRGVDGHTDEIIQYPSQKAKDIMLPIMAVTGRIIDMETEEPIPDLEVILSWEQNGIKEELAALTDDRGEYRLYPTPCFRNEKYTVSLAPLKGYTGDPVEDDTDVYTAELRMPDLRAKKAGDICGAAIGYIVQDDMWTIQLYPLDENGHMLLHPDTGNPIRWDIFGKYVAGFQLVGNVTVRKIDDRTILTEVNGKYLNIRKVSRLNNQYRFEEDPSALAALPSELELLFSGDLGKLASEKELLKRYYLPAGTTEEGERPIDKLLEDIQAVFPDPELTATNMKKAEDGTLISYQETYQHNNVLLIVNAYADGTITSIVIRDSALYNTETDYNYRNGPSSPFFIASESMRQLYTAVLTSQVLEAMADTEALRAFPFDSCTPQEDIMNGTRLGYSLKETMEEGSIIVTYIKSVSLIPGTYFRSEMQIVIQEP